VLQDTKDGSFIPAKIWLWVTLIETATENQRDG